MRWVWVRFISQGVPDEDYSEPEESEAPGEPSEAGEVDDIEMDNENTLAGSWC